MAVSEQEAVTESKVNGSAGIAGWVMTGLTIAFLLLDGGIKLIPIAPVIDTLASMGWPSDPTTARGLGVLLLTLTLLYAMPRTALVGAILLTGYLGGAVASHVRIASPLFSHTLFGVYVGILMWGGLWFRSARLRALVLGGV